MIYMIKRYLVVILILLCVANAAESATLNLDESEDDEVDVGFHEYFREFFTYETMMDALNTLEAQHSDIMRQYDLTNTIDPNNRMGIPQSTWQGRKVWAIKVSDGVDSEPEYYSDPTEPDVMIVGTHHGNEWPGFEISMYYLFFLVTNYGLPPTDNDGDGLINEDPVDAVDNDGDGLVDEDENEGRITWLVDNREIWIIPMFNPDGVAVDTRTNGRETVPFGPGGSTVPTNGVDVNRNYPFMWNREPDPTTGPTMDTSDPSQSVYRGPDDNFDNDGDAFYSNEYLPTGKWKWTIRNVDEDPVDNIDNDNDGKIDEDRDGGFSEPETVSMRNLIQSLDGNKDDQSDIITSISYHTYGGMVLYPWGYTNDPSEHDALFEFVATDLANLNGYDPMVGTELYPVSGEFDDWLYGKHDVICFTIEVDSAGYKGEPEDILNHTRINLPVNLYVAEYAAQIEVARERFGSSMDIGLPQINHTQKVHIVNSDNTYSVKVEISNSEKLKKDSIFLNYKAGESGKWKQMKMHTNDDVVYRARIPQQSGGRHVYYYVEGEAIYNEAVGSGGIIPVYSSPYGPYSPHSYFVDISLGDTFADIAAMILMMFFIFGIIYVGLGKSLKLAIDSEKRKNKA
jgi:hypothetical protein